MKILRISIFFILFTFKSNLTVGQIQGIVLTSDSTPIAFANVLLFKNGEILTGSASNEMGLFNISSAKVNTSDSLSLVVTSLGYGIRHFERVDMENQQLQVILFQSDSGNTQIEFTNCRHGYIQANDWYFNYSKLLTSDTIFIQSGESILNDGFQSQYNYELINLDSIYIDNMGNEYPGYSLIKSKFILYSKWDNKL